MLLLLLTVLRGEFSNHKTYDKYIQYKLIFWTLAQMRVIIFLTRRIPKKSLQIHGGFVGQVPHIQSVVNYELRFSENLSNTLKQ